jgi:negative regulator of sigma E activity
VTEYNRKLDVVNKELQVKAKDLEKEQIIIWNHKGRETMKDKIIDRDGTHLNQTGTWKFYRYIRAHL